MSHVNLHVKNHLCFCQLQESWQISNVHTWQEAAQKNWWNQLNRATLRAGATVDWTDFDRMNRCSRAREIPSPKWNLFIWCQHKSEQIIPFPERNFVLEVLSSSLAFTLELWIFYPKARGCQIWKGDYRTRCACDNNSSPSTALETNRWLLISHAKITDRPSTE